MPTVLATNTSSLSVTAIAAGLKHAQRFAGLHFFNPVPLMKVVEVIAGIKTDASVCDQLSQYVRQMGHTPVRASDTPGFIVNHAGRGYGTEALRIAGENITDFATIDRILKDQVGFKLGPFELMDLTALDVSHPVMESVYRQYYEEPRYRPSVITAQRAGRWCRRKKGGARFLPVRQGRCATAGRGAGTGSRRNADRLGSPRAARRAQLLQMLMTWAHR
jgi:3-hydroxybutyryl-CoA dehydrogenase